jgi:hypothetical protein
MEPSRNGFYDAAKVWDRRDSESSLSLLKDFADHYVLILESAVKDAAGDAALELAKRPKQTQPNSPENDSQRISLTYSAASTHPKGKAKAISAFEKKRRSVIFGAIQAKAEGPKYCKILYGRKLAIPADWIQDGCPKNYADAYKAGQPWQKRIQDEKSRYKKKYDETPKAEREKLLQ